MSLCRRQSSQSLNPGWRLTTNPQRCSHRCCFLFLPIPHLNSTPLRLLSLSRRAALASGPAVDPEVRWTKMVLDRRRHVTGNADDSGTPWSLARSEMTREGFFIREDLLEDGLIQLDVV